MAKEKDKSSSEKVGHLDVSNNKLTELILETAGYTVKDFDCSGNFLENLAYAPGIIKGDLICKNNKKISGEINRMTQYHLGAGRFNSFDGPEDEEENRPVKVSGKFITDANVYSSPKIYDSRVGLDQIGNANDNDDEADENTGNTGVVNLKNGCQMFIGIKNPILAFEQEKSEVSPGIFVDYSRRTPKAPYHADFKVRQGLTGGTAKYCTNPSIYGKSKWDGWGQPPFNFNGYVNWSFFNCYNGLGKNGDDGKKGNHIGWGKWAIVGTTILNGKPLGAKTDYMKNRPVYYYINNDPKLYRLPANEIYYSKEYTTGFKYDDKGNPSYDDAVFKASFLDNIRIALPAAAGPHILNDTLTGLSGYDYTSFPFFGKVSDGTYFAGVGPGMATSAKKVKTYFNKKGLKVEWMDNGDGGGSTQLYANGKPVKKSERNIPSVIGWNE